MKALKHHALAILARRTERGATATEYGVLMGFIALIIIAGVGLFGGAVDDMFARFATWVTANL